VIDRNDVHEGMVVRSSDGKKLGRVMACKEGSFIVEKGFFFATDYVARYDDVTDISGNEIRLSRLREGLAHGERTFTREGGLGESFTVGMGGLLDTSPREPRARAEEEEEDETRRGRPHGDEEEAGLRYNLSEHGADPPSYGDEGGGGLPG
jgi:hypothetical protein